MWITYVLKEDQLISALLLCGSLRRCRTNKPVAVAILTDRISMQNRRLLAMHFNLVIPLDREIKWESSNGRKKCNTFPRIITALRRLGFSEKIACLSPNMQVVRNCDEIFSHEANSDSDANGGSGTRVIDLMKLVTGDVVLNDMPHIIKFPKAEVMTNMKMHIGVNKIANAVTEYWMSIYNDLVKNKLEPPLRSHSFQAREQREPIAVVGMSCRFAGANNLDDFWNVLVNQQVAIGPPPSHRQSTGQYPLNFKMNAGYLQDPIDHFDNAFFGISAKETIYMDPQHRLLYYVIWEALENAGINPEEIRGKPGSLFLGSWNYRYKDILKNSSEFTPDFFREYMGSSSSSILGRIAMLLGFTGPTMAFETSCSASAVAVHAACKSLQNGETSFALACGVNLIVTPFERKDLPGMLAEDGHCKTFDVRADGYGRGEGCGVLVLKRLGDAIRDNDAIWGVIRGSAMSQEGLTRSLATPTVNGEALAMRRALRDAGVKSEQISYLECHGTGTVVGDATEIKAIREVYGSKKRSEDLQLGSLKTNIGHTESCSGIAGIMKVLLCMKHGKIPGQAGLQKLNPVLGKEMAEIPAVVPRECQEWKGRAKVAAVSCFGMTGTNTHFILEEAPAPESGLPELIHKEFSERPVHILKMTAKTEKALDLQLSKYRDHLSSERCRESMADIAFSANVGRMDMNHRAVIIGSSNEKISEKINTGDFLKGSVKLGESRDEQKICFLFTGQGSQFSGMCKNLYETSPVFQMNLDHCLEIIKRIDSELGSKLKDALWDISEKDYLKLSMYSQIAIFCVEYGLLKLWESWGVKPDIVLGHSLGEFAACVAAGILEVEEAIRLILERSRLIETLQKGSMLAIRESVEKVEELLSEFLRNNVGSVLDIAAVNSSHQTVVAGDPETVEKFGEFYKVSNGIKCKLLDSSHAYHSAHMIPILKKYENFASKIFNNERIFKNNKCEYISGMTGEYIEDQNVIQTASYWVDHTRKPVQFCKASKLALEMGTRIFLEVGPQPVLSALSTTNCGNISNLLVCPSIKRNECEWTTLLGSLGKLYVEGGVSVDWDGIDKWRVRQKVTLPHYPFIGKRFWPKVAKVAAGDQRPVCGKKHEYIEEDDAICDDENLETSGKTSVELNIELIESSIDVVIRKVLKMGKNDELDWDSDFDAIGVDSLMYVEIKEGVQKLLKRYVSKSSLGTERASVDLDILREFNSVHKLAQRVYDVIRGSQK